MSLSDSLKSFLVAVHLKSQVEPDNRPLKRKPKQRPQENQPVFRDLYAEQFEDPIFRKFDDDVKQAVANLKGGIK